MNSGARRSVGLKAAGREVLDPAAEAVAVAATGAGVGGKSLTEKSRALDDAIHAERRPPRRSAPGGAS